MKVYKLVYIYVSYTLLLLASYFLPSFGTLIGIIRRYRSSHLARRDAPTITTTATTMTACARRVARRGYADPLGMDDARHHIARRIRDVTVRALESYYTVMTYLAYLYDILLKILPRFHMQHYCFHHLESCLAPGRF